MRFNRVFAITETQTGGIWFTDQYTGLGYLQDKEFNYPRVFMEEGINFVREIYNTKKRLWISTKNGVFSYKNGIVSHFNQKNGLGFAQTWPLNFNSGDIYIGTLGNGINILNTDEENHPAPVVVFSDIKGRRKFGYNQLGYLCLSRAACFRSDTGSIQAGQCRLD